MGNVTTLGELVARGALRIGDGHRAKLDELSGGGPLFLRAGALSDRGFSWDGLEEFGTDQKLANKLGYPGDVVITTKGNSIGRTGFVPLDAPLFVYSPHLSYWRSLDPDVIVSRYFYYWARSEYFHSQLRGLGFGTDMAPYLSLRDQAQLVVDLPSAATQEAIADVLGALDDKIAANAHLATTASSLAEGLFRKAAVEAAERSPLGDVARIVLGGTPSRARTEFWTRGTVPWIASGKANEDRVLEPSEWISQEALVTSAAKLMPQGATILAITGATLGQVARLEIQTSGNQSLVGIWHDDPAANDWIYFAVRQEIGELLKHATGAAQQHVNKGAVEALKIPVPSPGLLRSWGPVVRPLLDMAAAADKESKRLAAAQDELLPLLMSGKIRVRDAEKVVEEAV